ncbi:MAG: FAD-dependent monooxygenase [Polyangiaceae bacterium]
MASERETRHVRVAVVGAGPAGTSTALHLVKAEGIDPSDIVVFDKARHPREKPCAGAVSAWGLRILAGIDVPITVPHVPMAGLRILDGPRTGTLEGTPLGVVVRRSEFDADLVRRARATGVPVFDGEAVVDIRRHGRSFVVRTKVRTVLADRLAACDGTGSFVRKRSIFVNLPGRPYVLRDCRVARRRRCTRASSCDFDLGPCRRTTRRVRLGLPDGHRRRTPRQPGHLPREPEALADVKAILARSLRERDVDPANVRFNRSARAPSYAGRPWFSRCRVRG